MAKYIDAELLEAELKRLIKKRDNMMRLGTYVSTSYVYEDILSLIDSLQQEQPDFQKADKKEQFQIDWESEIEEYWIASGWNMAISLSKFKVIARYFIGLALEAPEGMYKTE